MNILQVRSCCVDRDVQELKDTLEIMRLKGLYCELVDLAARDPRPHYINSFRAIFTDDAIIDFTALGAGVLAGQAAIVKHFSVTLAEAFPNMWHSVGSPIIDVVGDRAVGRWTLTARAMAAGDRGATPLLTYGRYVDEFLRAGDSWRLSKIDFHNETPEPVPPGLVQAL
jgi:SnoaL-like domain